MDVQTALNNFKAKIGQQLNNPLDYNGQCTGAANDFAESLGKRGFTGNANQWAGQNHDQWTWVNNTPSAVAVPGSIMCFSPNNATVGTGPFGHVDVCFDANVNSFDAGDQNWAGKQVLEEVHHPSYSGVMGWLVPIEAAPTPPPAPVGGTATTTAVCNVRTAPSTTAAITSVLAAHVTFQYQNKVVGQSVSGNNIWYHSTLGHFVWSGNVTG